MGEERNEVIGLSRNKTIYSSGIGVIPVALVAFNLSALNKIFVSKLCGGALFLY